MIKRILLILLAAGLTLGVIVGIEIVIALRRDYLPTQPALAVGGTFGRAGAERVKFTVLGDSTGAGVGVDDPALAYPSLLAARLSRLGYSVELRSYAVSGARAAGVLKEQVPRAIEDDPDLVFVAIGANDVTHLTPLSEVEDDVGAVIRELRTTGARVVVAGAPDMRAAAFLEPLRSLAGWRGRAVADAVADAARQSDTPVVPLAAATARYFEQDPDRYYSADLFHPSAAGYERWADAIYPYLRDALEGDR
ncbi:MAG: SGNH/GDSL hydrolase family protein [Actinomycetota bacterium]